MNVLSNKKLIIVVIVMFIVSSVTYVYARYYNNYKDSSLYGAENFYFNSDLLNTQGITYNYQRGIDSISIKVQNNDDDLRYSESDISYEVKITDVSGESVISSVSDENKSVTGTLKGGKISSETITFDNLSSGTYKVEAVTSSPYKKTLLGTFIITNKDMDLSYEISDNVGSTILFLTINTTDYKGKVNITIPDKLYPDNTIGDFSDIDVSKSKKITLNFNENSSYTYKFFKEDPNSLFDKNDFVIEGE